MHFSMVFFRKMFTWFNLLATLTRHTHTMSVSYIRLFMASSKPYGLGFKVSVTSSSPLGSLAAKPMPFSVFFIMPLIPSFYYYTSMTLL